MELNMFTQNYLCMTKKYLLLNLVVMLFGLLIFNNTNAQFCGSSGSSICTVTGSYALPGFYPSYDSLPCAVMGTPYTQKIEFRTPGTVFFQGSTYNLNWVRVDTIANLPCGLCWATGVSNNQFNGNSTNCIRVTGTTFDAPGQYKLRIKVSANVQLGFFPITVNNQDADSLGLKYFIRVRQPGGTCPDVDTLAVGNFRTPPSALAAPTISGNTTICSGQSTTLTASTGNYHTYVWSNNTLGAVNSVTQAGQYTVTAYGNCNSATASVNVTQTAISANISPSGPTTFCQGGSVDLSVAAGAASYAWSTGATTNQITANQTGNYSVTVTQGACTASSSISVNVTSNNLQPAISPATANICPGGSVDLDAGQGYDSYTWSDNSSSQSLFVNAGGTYTVTVTQGACSGTASATVNLGNFPLTVNITPSGLVQACAGDVVTLDAGNDYTIFNWSNGDQTQTIDVTTSNTYIVTAFENGCVGIDTVVVQINPVPSPNITPAGNQAICDGKVQILNAGAGFSSYLWSNGSTTQSIVVSNAGSYDVTVTQNGCSGSSPNPVTVTVNPNPAASLQIVPVNDSISLLIANPLNASSYVWTYAANMDTTNAANFLPFPINSDTFDVNCKSEGGYWRVAVTNSFGCADTTSFILVPLCEVNSVENTDLVKELRYWPNPTNGQLTVYYNIPETMELQWTVTDVNGKIVQQQTQPHTSGAAQHIIDVRSMPAGMYIVRLGTDKGNSHFRFIKD